MTARPKTEEDMPALSSDEDSLLHDSFKIRDHDLDPVTFRTGKITSIRSVDIIREYLEWCQVCLLYTSPSPRDRG